MTGASRTLEEVVEGLFCLPAALRLRGNVSLVGLVEEAGYAKFREEITGARLQEAIRGRVGLVEAWLAYSAGKEENWGWFFEGPYQGFYLVGCRTNSFEGPWSLPDPEEACARFIKGELDAISGRRASQTSSPIPDATG